MAGPRVRALAAGRRAARVHAVGDGPSPGSLTAAQHGEEAVTALLVRRLLERVPGDRTAWAVVPVVNPDGLLAGTRQNDAGVDLNRNFPASTWVPDASFTYPPGVDPALRRPEHRTNRSSPGAQARLGARDQGADRPDRAAAAAARGRSAQPARGAARASRSAGGRRRAARGAADLSVIDEIEGCPGAFDDWLAESGIPAIVYEIEQGGLPEICARHLPGLEGAAAARAVDACDAPPPLRLQVLDASKHLN